MAAMKLPGLIFQHSEFYSSPCDAIAGALLTTMIVNILFFAQIDPLYQSFYEGLFLVIAVVSTMAIGRLIKRRR